jgi:hypothetical protein
LTDVLEELTVSTSETLVNYPPNFPDDEGSNISEMLVSIYQTTWRNVQRQPSSVERTVDNDGK